MEAIALNLGMIALEMKKGTGCYWGKGSARGGQKMEAIALDLGMIALDRKRGHG